MGEEAAAAAASRNVSMILFNVWGLPGFATDGKTRRRMKSVPPIIAPYDIVVLNEAFLYRGTILHNVPHRYKYELGRQWHTVFDSGLVLLSKFPMKECASEHFKQRTGVDWFAAKGMIWCRLQLPAGSGAAADAQPRYIDMFGTHMQAGNLTKHHNARMDQAQQLGEFVQKHTRPGGAAVLAGDVNMGPVMDPTYETYSGYFSDETDARLRNQQFEALVQASGMEDVPAPGSEDTLMRFLARNVAEISVYLLHKPGVSDGDPFEAHMTIR